MNKTIVATTGIITVGILAFAAMVLFRQHTLFPPATTDTVSPTSLESEKNTTAVQPSESSPAHTSISGTLSLVRGSYILASKGTSYIVRNSANAKLAAILDLFIGKSVRLEGIMNTQFPNEITVLTVDGKTVVAEDDAFDATPLEQPLETGGFSTFYNPLPQNEKSCIETALGKTTLQNLLKNSIPPTQKQLETIQACVTN